MADLAPFPSPLRLSRWLEPDPAEYRALFRAVGGPWLWYSRLAMPDDALVAATHRPQTHVNVATGPDGERAGFVELTFPEPDWCAIDFLGLVPGWIGRGQGRWLLRSALALAWSPGVSFVRVNTCTLDHPAALPNYIRAGFRVTGRSVETFPDPRLSGVLATNLAPHAPAASPLS